MTILQLSLSSFVVLVILLWCIRGGKYHEWAINEWLTNSWSEWHVNDNWATYEWHVNDTWTTYERHASDIWSIYERITNDLWMINDQAAKKISRPHMNEHRTDTTVSTPLYHSPSVHIATTHFTFALPQVTVGHVGFNASLFPHAHRHVSAKNRRPTPQQSPTVPNPSPLTSSDRRPTHQPPRTTPRTSTWPQITSSLRLRVDQSTRPYHDDPKQVRMIPAYTGVLVFSDLSYLATSRI